MEVPPIQFAHARRGARIAYQEWGEGVPVVAIPPAAQNIEFAWEWPSLREFFERFGSFCHFVHYDKRGTGSSDRTIRVPHVDDRVDDLRAVMDAAGIERAHLFTQSEGGVTTLLFAAAYPHRVESLIFLGSAARMYQDGEMTDERRKRYVRRVGEYVSKWGTPDTESIAMFAPSQLDNPEFCAWFPRYERYAASADSLQALMIEMVDFDATDVIGDIEAPMLVLHRTNDNAMPLEFGREIADLAQNATFVELPGIDHYAFLGDLDAWLEPVERWVTGTVSERPTSVVPSGTSHVTTLGRFAVTVDGREVETGEWGSRRARTLLKRLVAARGWPVTRDELFDLLWPDEIDRARLGSRLSVQLSHVRRVLGGGVIADRDTIAIDGGQVSSDLDELLSSDDDGRIIELDTGEFLPEDRYDDWTISIREQVNSTVAAAIRRRLAALEADGGANSPEAVRLAARHDELATW